MSGKKLNLRVHLLSSPIAFVLTIAFSTCGKADEIALAECEDKSFCSQVLNEGWYKCKNNFIRQPPFIYPVSFMKRNTTLSRWWSAKKCPDNGSMLSGKKKFPSVVDLFTSRRLEVYKPNELVLLLPFTDSIPNFPHCLTTMTFGLDEIRLTYPCNAISY